MARQIIGDFLKRGDLPSLPPDQIVVVHNENTRLYEPDVSDLVESFLREGQIQPCVTRPLPDGRVQLVAGYRRWLAAMQISKQQSEEGVAPEDRFKLAFTVIPKMSATEALDKNIIENDLRQSLSPVEYAHAIRRLRIAHGWQDAEGTQKIANMFRGANGKPRSISWVTTMEDLLSLSEGEQREVHLHFISRGEEGLSQTVAQVLATVPEERREKVLEEARAASMKGKSNIPKTASAGNANIKVRDIANVAEKNGATSTKARQVKDLYELIDSYGGDAESVQPLHPVTKEFLKRLRGFMAREITDAQFDNTIMKIDGCLAMFYEKYTEKKKAAK